MNIAVHRDEQAAIAALAAFGPRDRRAVFRKLIRADAKPRTAEDLAGAVGIPETAVAEHLDRLEQAGLLRARHDGRAVAYAVDHQRTSELWGFLMANCCQDNPDFGGGVRTGTCC